MAYLSLEADIVKISEQAPGRCPTCVNSVSWDLPDGPRHWCRAFGTMISPTKRLQIRHCPSWRAFSPHPDRSRGVNEDDPMLKAIIDAEDYLFWKSKVILDHHGLCLKTLVSVSHPTAKATEGDLDWIDSLDARFLGMDPPDVGEVLAELRALSYFSLALMIETALGNNA